jgi:hypothetical protein
VEGKDLLVAGRLEPGPDAVQEPFEWRARHGEGLRGCGECTPGASDGRTGGSWRPGHRGGQARSDGIRIRGTSGKRSSGSSVVWLPRPGPDSLPPCLETPASVRPASSTT